MPRPPSGQPDLAPKLSAAASPSTQLAGSRAHQAQGLGCTFSGREMIWGHPGYRYHWVCGWTGTRVSPDPSGGSEAAYLQTSSFHLILSLGLPLWVAGTDHTWWDPADLCSHLALPCWGGGFFPRAWVGGRIWELRPQLCSHDPNSDLGFGVRKSMGATLISRFPGTSARRRSS